ncbi:PstS family phosphate ABC transporter substrate-binding protein [Parasediminibacterium paludis]|uniref:PstS family phosphate ABC transporter substrate-binding protein n=1 Tax=Parasediminibacterium paludis TaxID=908966 RepID=A0ABV8PUU3_9BACT
MKQFFAWVLVFVGCLACNDATKQQKAAADTFDKGQINISVDESFKPVIEEQIKVYESTYPNTKIIASYKPEVECFKDFQSDSTRLIIVARGLNKNERQYYESTLKFMPYYTDIAYDAIAVIVNRKGSDSVFTMADLKNILTGKKNITAVMDGKNATSTVRYLQDSVLKGQAFGTNVVAAKNSEDVVNIVSNTDNAIGFVGLSWIGNGYDAKQQAQLKTVKLALVECTICKDGEFARPSQATITYLQYPLARPLYYIVKENTTQLGTGFGNFMGSERGQLIFRRAFLAPSKISFKKRSSNIKTDD